MRLRAIATLAALLLGGLALTGCTTGSSRAHNVLLATKSTAESVQLTYRINGGAPHEIAEPADAVGSDRVASVDLRLKAGTLVSIDGGPPSGPVGTRAVSATPSPDQITCTVAVDGVSGATESVSGTPTSPPTCAASQYVVHRPARARRALEYGAFVVCLLIVVVGIGAQLSSGRQRA